MRTTTFAYDLSNILTSVQVDLGTTRRTTFYTYDAGGQLTAWTTTEVPL